MVPLRFVKSISEILRITRFLDQVNFFTLNADAGIVPDGSVIDDVDYFWNACWNGAAVHRYDHNGVMVEKVNVPVSRPTSCTFGKNGELFITSASVDMSAKQLRKEPLAGSVLMIKTPYRGAVKHYLNFSLDSQAN